MPPQAPRAFGRRCPMNPLALLATLTAAAQRRLVWIMLFA
jgi:hypothetical protein